MQGRAVYEAKADDQGDIVAYNIEHTGTFGDAEAIGDRLYALAFMRGVENCTDVVVLGDGGRWIWKQAKNNFPKATQILDFYHAAEHLSEVADAWYGGGTKKAAAWLEERSLDFLEGRWEKVMRSIRAWKPVEAKFDMGRFAMIRLRV